jgi:hypothetical protein
VVIAPDGLVLTNSHVVAGTKSRSLPGGGQQPVSKLKFPNNREKYRENRKIGPRNDDEIIDKASIHTGF